MLRNATRARARASVAIGAAMALTMPALTMPALTMPALADEAADAKVAASIVKAFSTLCVQSMADLDSVERSAAGLQWRQLRGAEAKAFATPSPDATTKTWDVQHYADVPFSLSITHGMEDGKPVSACTIINSDMPAPPTKAAMVDILGLKYPFRTETEGDQDFTYWQVRPAGLSVIVALMNATVTTAKGINISATLIAKRPFR